MNTDIVLPGFVVKSSEKEDTKELISNINSLKKEMVQMGYNQGEINYLIKKYAGCYCENDKEIGYKSLLEVYKLLDNHVHMAKKCMKIK